jgi:hypothetical protein
MYQLLVTTSLKTFSNEACSLRTDVLKFDSERAADVAYKQIQDSRGGSAYDYRHVVKLY